MEVNKKMDAIKEFFVHQVTISDGFTVQNWMFLAVAIAVVLLVIVLISSVKNSKKAKADESAPPVEIVEKPLLSADEASKQYFEVINQTIDLPIVNVNTETKIEVVPTPIIVEKVVVEKPVFQEETKLVEVAVAATTDAISLQVFDDDIVIIDEPDEEKTVSGKFTICNSSVGGFRYMLLANNGQLLYESRDYKAKATCIDAVEKFCIAVKENGFTVKKDKFDRYKFNLRPQNNNNTVFIGESFKDKSSCLSNIESVKRFVDYNSPIVDRTNENFMAESTKYEVSQNVKDAVNGKIGMPGKWDIAKVDEDDKLSPYEFLLFANNGQLLYESKEYKTYASCKSGLITFIETVRDGNFIIDSDKAGRFKFILRSNKAGSQAEYIGQFYRSQDACESSIDSLYKFAILSSTESLK